MKKKRSSSDNFSIFLLFLFLFDTSTFFTSTGGSAASTVRLLRDLAGKTQDLQRSVDALHEKMGAAAADKHKGDGEGDGNGEEGEAHDHQADDTAATSPRHRSRSLEQLEQLQRLASPVIGDGTGMWAEDTMGLGSTRQGRVWQQVSAVR